VDGWEQEERLMRGDLGMGGCDGREKNGK
jgi:hypothetical protein